VTNYFDFYAVLAVIVAAAVSYGLFALVSAVNRRQMSRDE
jgi:hypothetical protein